MFYKFRSKNIKFSKFEDNSYFDLHKKFAHLSIESVAYSTELNSFFISSNNLEDRSSSIYSLTLEEYQDLNEQIVKQFNEFKNPIEVLSIQPKADKY